MADPSTPVPSDERSYPANRGSGARNFWTKVDITPGCWLWQGEVNTANGYGRFTMMGKLVMAHRFAYEQRIGPIPEGLVIDHLCRVRHCVNPAHMEPVTNRENVLRGIGITAECARKTHCPSGHEYNEANTYRDSKGRKCRLCQREHDRRYRERKRAERSAA